MELVTNDSDEFLSDHEAASTLAQFHRAEAAKLPPESTTRALMLRCAGRWSRIAGERHLSAVDGREETDGMA
jgi:hypothetical protein